MEATIVKPQHGLLKKYVQYYLFLDKTYSAPVNYTTFPNSNLCLAIYRRNSINHTRGSGVNFCAINDSDRYFCSRIYSGHAMPFNVDIQSPLDQICIIFHPSALSAFTKESIFELQKSDSVFEDLFRPKNRHALEQLFGQKKVSDRSLLLEKLLLDQLIYQIPPKVQEALEFIKAAGSCDPHAGTTFLSKKLKISDTTLFRLFRTYLGQNPQQYIKTLRFRNTLTPVLDQAMPYTQIALENRYYDQAHFNRDFKIFTGMSPRKLRQQVTFHQDRLLWIYKN